jgi:hypothetical protein
VLRAGRRRERETHRPEHRPREHRAARADAIDEHARSDQCRPGAEQACGEHCSELEQRQPVVVEQLGADRGEAEVHEGDRHLRDRGAGEHRAGRPAGGCGHPPDYPCRVDRDALARDGRRAQAEEALLFEREREAALRHQIAELVLEQEGPRLDAAAFATLDGDDVRRVREALGQFEVEEAEDEDPFVEDLYVDLEGEPEQDEEEDEIARLARAVDDSVRTQEALERFIAALDVQ